MDLKKKFINQYIPSSFDPLTILHVTTKKEQEMIVLDIAPTEKNMQLLCNQSKLPANISFQKDTFQFSKNAVGAQGCKEVVVMCINTIPYQSSPYQPWFAAYPRATGIYVGSVVLLAGMLYFFS